MNNLISRLLKVNYPYRTDVLRSRAETLLAFNWFILLMWLVLTIFGTLPNLIQPSTATTFLLVFSFLVPFSAFFVYISIQSGYVTEAAWLLLVTVLIVASLPAFGEDYLVHRIVMVLPILLGAVLLGWRGIALSLIVALGTLLIEASSLASLVAPYIIDIEDRLATDVVRISGVTVGVGLIAGIFIVGTQRRNARQTQQIRALETVSAFAGQLDPGQDENQMMVSAIRDLVERADYYSAQILLTAGTDRLTRRLYSRIGFRDVVSDDNLTLPADSPLQRVHDSGSVLLLDRNASLGQQIHFLPDATHQALIPITAGAERLGVLDIQQRDNRAISEIEVQSLGNLSRQLGAAIQASRTIAYLESALADDAELIATLQMEAGMDEERAAGLAAGVWDEYLQGRGQAVLGYDLRPDGGGFESMTDLPAGLPSQWTAGEIVVEAVADGQILHVPLSQDTQLLGFMDFQFPAETPITERQKTLVQNVVQRFLLTLDNRRLFEQSRTQFERESLANTISTALLASTDIQGVLDSAALSFQDALGAVTTRIDIQPDVRRATTGPGDRA
jgi:K+-sensing histidine kinase KdpD